MSIKDITALLIVSTRVEVNRYGCDSSGIDLHCLHARGGELKGIREMSKPQTLSPRAWR